MQMAVSTDPNISIYSIVLASCSFSDIEFLCFSFLYSLPCCVPILHLGFCIGMGWVGQVKTAPVPVNTIPTQGTVTHCTHMQMVWQKTRSLSRTHSVQPQTTFHRPRVRSVERWHRECKGRGMSARRCTG